MNIMKIAAGMVCPRSTSDSELNANNQKIAIKEADYGPVGEEKASYWDRISERLSLPIEVVKQNICENCGVWDKTKDIMDCIASGRPEEDVKDLGYCRIYQFCCSKSRTCLNWVPDGPIVDSSQ